MPTFAVQLQFDRDDDARLEARPAHRNYLNSLAAAGKVRLAGPCAEGDGALLVYDVADRAELDAVIGGDPYFSGEPVASIVSIHDWELLPLESAAG